MDQVVRFCVDLYHDLDPDLQQFLNSIHTAAVPISLYSPGGSSAILGGFRSLAYAVILLHFFVFSLLLLLLFSLPICFVDDTLADRDAHGDVCHQCCCLICSAVTGCCCSCMGHVRSRLLRLLLFRRSLPTRKQSRRSLLVLFQESATKHVQVDRSTYALLIT